MKKVFPKLIQFCSSASLFGNIQTLMVIIIVIVWCEGADLSKARQHGSGHSTGQEGENFGS
jgi:hypothetical protein